MIKAFVKETDREADLPHEPPAIPAGIGSQHASTPLWRSAASGTDGSNPSSSSKQSVSREISPSCIEKPAVAVACAGPARRYGPEPTSRGRAPQDTVSASKINSDSTRCGRAGVIQAFGRAHA
jgi:hypothetical protein